MVSFDGDTVSNVQPISGPACWINGGFFIFRIGGLPLHAAGRRAGRAAVPAADRQERELLAYKYDGYWGCMDTFKEKQVLEDLYSRGDAPWEVWKGSQSGPVGGGNGDTVRKNGNNHSAATLTGQFPIQKAETRP